MGLYGLLSVFFNVSFNYSLLNFLIRNAGYPVNHDDVKRLSPLGYDHINIVGHYSFNLPEELMHGKLRPLQAMDSKIFGKI